MKLFTAVIFVLLFSFLGFSMEANPSPRFDSDTLALPFADDFTSGVFATSRWTTSNDSWHINTQTGNIIPCAEFQPVYPLINYEETLTSGWIDGTSVTDCRIYLDFDIKLLDAMITGNEKLIVEILNDTVWVGIFEFRSTGSTDWDSKHLNITTLSRSKIFKLRFRTTGENTFNIVSWQIDNINVHMVCERPGDAYINLLNFYLNLHWTTPGIAPPGLWKHWDNGNNAGNGIGLTNGGTFDAAIRFTPEQLAIFANYDAVIRKIKFFPYGGNGSIVLKVWQGSEPPELIYSQPVDYYTIGQWNVCNIDSIFYIDITQELWIGYQISHQANQFPAGIDVGPAVVGFGDMISIDGITWDPLSSNGPDFNCNWNIQAYIGELAASDTCFPIEYYIFRDDEYFATTQNTDYYIEEETSCYQITALYNDGESQLSNEACIWIDVDKIDINSVTLNPNPASGVVNIQLVPGISKIEILDLKGCIVSTYSTNPLSTQFVIDVSDYTPGIYLMRFDGTKVIFEKKLVVQ